MKFLWFLFFYPFNIFKLVNKSELRIYLTFQKVIRSVLAVALVLLSIQGLFFIYPQIVTLYNNLSLPFPFTLQIYPSVAIGSLTVTLISAIYVFMNLNKTKMNVEKLKEHDLVRMHDVTYTSIDLLLLFLLILLAFLSANLLAIPYQITY